MPLGGCTGSTGRTPSASQRAERHPLLSKGFRKSTVHKGEHRKQQQGLNQLLEGHGVLGKPDGL